MITLKVTENKTTKLYLVKPRKMSDELKIVDAVVCGSPWADADNDGILYTIQVGDNPKNTRLAFVQTGIGKPVWVKKGRENEALASVNGDITTKPHLFDLNGKEPREALCKLFEPKDVKGCAGLSSRSCADFPRRALG